MAGGAGSQELTFSNGSMQRSERPRSVVGLSTLEASSNDVLPPARLPFLNLPKHHRELGMSESIGSFLIQAKVRGHCLILRISLD